MSAALVNLLIGLSFGFLMAVLLNRFISAFLRGEPSMFNHPTCNSCGTQYSWGDQFPVFGYLNHSRKCNTCSHKKSFMPPLYELAMILFSVWAFTQLEYPQALQISLLFFALIGITMVDLAKWIIPNIFVLVIFLVGILGISFGHISILNSLQGMGVALIVSSFILLPQFINKSEYALGDVKLSLAVALWLGWILSVYVFFLASILATLTWLFMGIFKGYSNKRSLQFGPFVALSTLIFGIGRLVDPQLITHLLTFRF